MLKKSFLLPGACLFLATSCVNVYLEKPMPETAAELRTLPAEWNGVFQMTEEGSDFQNEGPFIPCLRFSAADKGHLLISYELRLPKTGLDGLRAYLEEKRTQGAISHFELSSGGIFTRSEADGHPETAFLNLIPAGDWYIVPQSCHPVWSVSIPERQFTEYEISRQTALSGKILEGQDSVSLKACNMSLRKKGDQYYLNFQKEETDTPYWSLYRIQNTAPGQLTVTINQLKSGTDFEREQARYNQITPFSKINTDDYLIRPTDKTLETLLDDPGLLRRMILKKIADN
jgi:hypothetical protein